MINTPFTYNSFVLNDTPRLYHLTSIEGFDDVSMREARENKPAAHGQNDYGQFLAERLITLNGTILATSSTQRDGAVQDLLDAFIKDGIYRWLTWTVTGEVAKQVYCKVFSKKVTQEYSNDPFMREFTINLLAVDPRIYSQIETTSTVYIPTSTGGFSFPLTFPLNFGTARVGGTVSCNNLGNFESLPLIRIYGPVNAPEIKNVTDSNKYIKVNMVVSSGDYLEINLDSKTIMLNGTASRYLYLNSGSNWFSLLSGNNSLTFKDSGGNVLGYAQIIFRSSWI